MKKKLLVIVLAVGMLVSFGCANKANNGAVHAKSADAPGPNATASESGAKGAEARSTASSRPAAAASASAARVFCESACGRISTCSDAICDVMSVGMPEAARVRVRTAMRKEMSDVPKCIRKCTPDVTAHPDSEENRGIRACMAKPSDCKVFAACFKVVISQHKSKPVEGKAPHTGPSAPVEEKTPHTGPSAPSKTPAGSAPR